MTESQVRRMVEKRLKERGSMRRLASEWGMTASNISRYLDGQYRAGPKILRPLGLKVKSVVYEPATAGS
jgi:predicted transcriptional regulator